MSRQFGILSVLCVFGLFAPSAQAGYISFDSSTNLASQSFNLNSSMSGSSSSSVPLDQTPAENPRWDFFAAPNMSMHLGHTGSGGMSSVSSTSGGQAPVAMVVVPEALTPSLITPLVIGDEPYTPRMLIAEIFRPPQV